MVLHVVGFWSHQRACNTQHVCDNQLTISFMLPGQAFWGRRQQRRRAAVARAGQAAEGLTAEGCPQRGQLSRQRQRQRHRRQQRLGSRSRPRWLSGRAFSLLKCLSQQAICRRQRRCQDGSGSCSRSSGGVPKSLCAGKARRHTACGLAGSFGGRPGICSSSASAPGKPHPRAARLPAPPALAAVVHRRRTNVHGRGCNKLQLVASCRLPFGSTRCGGHVALWQS